MKTKTKKKRKQFGGLTRKVNCHPGVNKIIDSSCYTAKSLYIMKDAYNKKHPDKIITENDPKKIWQHLNIKIPECDSETCWLNYIPNRNLQEKMKKQLFSPSQPKEWKTDKNTWLSNFDIDAVIQQYEEAVPSFLFLGPTPIDFDKIKNGKCVWEELCKLSLAKEYKINKKRKFGVIFNLDTSDGPGTHWVSLFIDLDCKEPFIFYFNSTAESTPKEVKDLVSRMKRQYDNMRKESFFRKYKKTNIKIFENGKMEHQKSDTECGMYSLFFIITCLTRKIDQKNEKTMTNQELVDLFAGKTRIPDEYVEKYRGTYFNA
jgi:hypothetical protein